MDVLISKGDVYTDARGNYVYINGIEEILQQIKLCAKIKKGSFIYNKELGSLVCELDFEKENALSDAEMLLNEAVADLKGIYVKVTGLKTDDIGKRTMNLQIEMYNQTVNTEVVIDADL